MGKNEMFAILVTEDTTSKIVVDWFGVATEKYARERMSKLAGLTTINERNPDDSPTLVCRFGGTNIVMKYFNIELHRFFDPDAKDD